MSVKDQGHKIKVESSFSLSGTRVWIDDKEINGVRNVQFEHCVYAPPLVILTISPNSVEISGDAATAKLIHAIPVSQEILWAQLAERLHDGTVRLTMAGLQALLDSIKKDDRLA